MAKVIVDKGKCQGHARCYALEPSFFDLDEEGYINFEKKQVPPDGDVSRIKRGVNACPERALKFVPED